MISRARVALFVAFSTIIIGCGSTHSVRIQAELASMDAGASVKPGIYADAEADAIRKAGHLHPATSADARVELRFDKGAPQTTKVSGVGERLDLKLVGSGDEGELTAVVVSIASPGKRAVERVFKASGEFEKTGILAVLDEAAAPSSPR